jgi:hypothetical protein|tara:strand:+ start:34 stop:276 length:243 start_codon:yes stop_codon:yes gene_type:complete
MNDADFDRALGAWEDNLLNAHFTEEEAYDKAYTEAEGAVWGMKLSELYEIAPVAAERKIEIVAEIMFAHVAQLIIDGGLN